MKYQVPSNCCSTSKPVGGLPGQAGYRLLVVGVVLMLMLARCLPAWGVVNVGEICRIKGQERNTLQGMGLVVGLKGTGDGTFSPTARSLIQLMTNMGIPMTTGEPGASVDLKEAKNVALVYVTAEVPAQGGRQGDEIDCTVSAVNAKSLQGGMLMLTPMLGPVPPGARPEDAQVYAFARGRVKMDDDESPTTAKVTSGCRMEQNFMNLFVKDNIITLVLNPSHARFEVVEEVAFQINNDPEFGIANDDSRPQVARPIDQVSIEITIPEEYRSKPVQFAARMLEVRLPVIPSIETVVVNETTGVISMSAELEITPQVLQHKNMSIEIENGLGVSQFSALDPGADTAVPTLQALVQSLNALRVSGPDMIDIIHVLDEAGAIHGRVKYTR